VGAAIFLCPYRRRLDAGSAVHEEGDMLRLRDIMTTDLVTMSPDATLRDTAEVLSTRHFSGAPVVAGGKVVGVISLTDLAAFAASAPGVATARPQVVDMGEVEGEVDAATDWADGDEPPARFFTEMWADVGEDVSKRFAETEEPEWNVLEEHTVSEVMNRTLCRLPPQTLVDEAARFMHTAGVHRVLVMSGETLLGLVTTKDISDAVAEHKLVTRTYLFDPGSKFSERGWE
jgi:CBS domain-containing protein